jgi:putative transposase
VTNYRRARQEGGCLFFTVVTYDRRRFLTENRARECLRAAWDETLRLHPFEVVAVCLLPDHLHCIWRLPEGDEDYSSRWARIKAGFTRRYLRAGGEEATQTRSRRDRRERGVWQRRFWEHRIRDGTDLQRHVDYIHFNPVKHGLVPQIHDWPWSSFHRYIREGFYQGYDWTVVREATGQIEACEWE